MMARPNGDTTTDGIDWREARYLARLVQMLVSSQPGKAELKRDLEQLVSAAEARRFNGGGSRAADDDDAGQPDHQGRADGEAERAVLALWRRSPSDVCEDTDERREEAAAVDTPDVSHSGTSAVDDTELAHAIEGGGTIAAGDSGPRQRPLRV
jgi:hypothetical protein